MNNHIMKKINILTLTGILLFTAIPVSAAPTPVLFTGGTIEYMVADEPVVISVSENNAGEMNNEALATIESDNISVEKAGPIKNVEHDDPYSLYDYVSFTRTQSRGKAVLDYGEWKFDQTFARGELFNAFQQARGTGSNYRMKDNDGNWYYVDKKGFKISDPSKRDGLATPYVWDCHLEAVAMQRAIEQVDMDSHYRPDKTSQSTAYREYSASGYKAYTGSDADILNPYWWSRNTNELTVCNAAAAAVANDGNGIVEIFMEEDRPAGMQGHRRIILTDMYYRIGIGVVRTASGRILIAVELSEDVALDGSRIPVTGTDKVSVDTMESYFDTVYLTYGLADDVGYGKEPAINQNSVETDENGVSKGVNFTYYEDTPISERPTYDMKQVRFGDTVGKVFTAKWGDKGIKDGKEVSILGDTWVVGNPDVVQIDESGIVTPVGPGMSTVYSVGGVFSGSQDFTVTEIPRPKFSIKPDYSSSLWELEKTDADTYATFSLPYKLVDATGATVKVTENDVQCTTDNSKVSVTKSASADGMSGTFVFTYNGNFTPTMPDGTAGMSLTFSSASKYWDGNQPGGYITIQNRSGETAEKEDTDTKQDDRGSDTVSVTSAKAQTISVAKAYRKTYTLSQKKVKKTGKVLNLKVKVNNGSHGKVSYKVTYPKKLKKAYRKYFKVKKNGKVYISRKVRKGTYKVTITAAAVKGIYKKATKTVTIKIK